MQTEFVKLLEKVTGARKVKFTRTGGRYEIGYLVFDAKQIKFMAKELHDQEAVFKDTPEKCSFLRTVEYQDERTKAQRVGCPWLFLVEQNADNKAHRLTTHVLMKNLQCLSPMGIQSFDGRYDLAAHPFACVVMAQRLPQNALTAGMRGFIDSVFDSTAINVGCAAAQCKEDEEDQEKLTTTAVLSAMDDGVKQVLVRSPDLPAAAPLARSCEGRAQVRSAKCALPWLLVPAVSMHCIVLK